MNGNSNQKAELPFHAGVADGIVVYLRRIAVWAGILLCNLFAVGLFYLIIRYPWATRAIEVSLATVLIFSAAVASYRFAGRLPRWRHTRRPRVEISEQAPPSDALRAELRNAVLTVALVGTRVAAYAVMVALHKLVTYGLGLAIPLGWEHLRAISDSILACVFFGVYLELAFEMTTIFMPALDSVPRYLSGLAVETVVLPISAFLQKSKRLIEGQVRVVVAG
jgi:hypothetical protein